MIKLISVLVLFISWVIFTSLDRYRSVHKDTTNIKASLAIVNICVINQFGSVDKSLKGMSPALNVADGGKMNKLKFLNSEVFLFTSAQSYQNSTKIDRILKTTCVSYVLTVYILIRLCRMIWIFSVRKGKSHIFPYIAHFDYAKSYLNIYNENHTKKTTYLRIYSIPRGT